MSRGILIRLYNRVDEAAVAADLIHRFMPEAKVVVVSNDMDGRFPIDTRDFPHVSVIHKPPAKEMTQMPWDGTDPATYDYKQHIRGDGETIREGNRLLLKMGCRYQLWLTADAWMLGYGFIEECFQRLERGAVWVSTAWTDLKTTLAYDICFCDGEYVAKNEIWPAGAGHKSMPGYYKVNISEKWLHHKFKECGVLKRVHVLKHIWPIHPEANGGKPIEKWKYVEHKRGEWKRRGYLPEMPAVTYHSDKIGGIGAKKKLANRCANKQIFQGD